MNLPPKNKLDRLVQALGSPRLSFLLLAILCMLAAQKAVLIQTAVDEDIPTFIRMLMSLKAIPSHLLGPLLLMVLVLFVINLIFSSVRMMRKVRIKLSSFSSFKTSEEIGRMGNNTDFVAAADPIDSMSRFFRGLGFTVAVENRGEARLVRAGKRSAGLWGIFFFHTTFMALLLGILISMLTSFAGYVALSPGDIFVEKRGSYMRATNRPFLFGEDRLFRIRLDSIDTSYWQPGMVKERGSTVTLFTPDGSPIGQRRLAINQPASVGETKVYQGTRQGFAAKLVVSDRTGNTVKATARFLFPEKPEDTLKCVLPLPGTKMNLLLELVTDRLLSVPGLESLAPKHPATLIKVHSIENGPPVFRGVMFPGTGLAFEDLKVGFLGLQPYSSIVVKRDYGVPLIFSSFLLLIAGLLVAYYWVPENWWVSCEREGDAFRITVGATTERYGASFSRRFSEKIEELHAKVLNE